MEAASAVSAAMMGISGDGVLLGREAQLRVWASFDGSRPAIARELKLLVLRNFRASLRTCLPVKPEAPRITMSNFGF